MICTIKKLGFGSCEINPILASILHSCLDGPDLKSMETGTVARARCLCVDSFSDGVLSKSLGVTAYSYLAKLRRDFGVYLT